MNKIHITLWTSRSCGYCPPAKEIARLVVKDRPNLDLTIRTVDDEMEAAEEANLTVVPTWIMTDGQNTHRINGAVSRQQLVEALVSLFPLETGL